MPIPGPVDRLLAKAAALARPAVSNFKVGAVVRGASGTFYVGANLEFTGRGLGTTVHAEQAAVANAVAHGETGITLLAVTAFPCGHCRQFLYELRDAGNLSIVVGTAGPVPLATLLPSAFGPDALGVHERLMEGSPHNLTLTTGSDSVAEAALHAANRSYAPYTRTYSGIALELADGSVHTGASIESVAFNPTLPPLQAALAALVIAGVPYAAIRRAVLAEADGPISYADATEPLLASLAPNATFARVRALAL